MDRMKVSPTACIINCTCLSFSDIYGPAGCVQYILRTLAPEVGIHICEYLFSLNGNTCPDFPLRAIGSRDIYSYEALL